MGPRCNTVVSVSAELQLFSRLPTLVAEQLGISGRGFVGPVGSDVALPGFMQKVAAPLLVCRFLLKRFGVEVLCLRQRLESATM